MKLRRKQAPYQGQGDAVNRYLRSLFGPFEDDVAESLRPEDEASGEHGSGMPVSELGSLRGGFGREPVDTGHEHDLIAGQTFAEPGKGVRGDLT
jgi:hypothetical protein